MTLLILIYSKRLTQLKQKNAQLKRALVDAMLNNQILGAC